MRSRLRTSLCLTGAACAMAVVTCAASAQPARSVARPAETADEARARNAREREANEKGFAEPGARAQASVQAPNRASVDEAVATVVCKAAIAALMAQSPSTVNASIKDGVVTTSYVRARDQTLWSNRCKISGSTVVWASEPGRWRDHPADEKISFVELPGRVVIRQTFGDGSFSDKQYPLEDLLPSRRR